MARPMRKRRSVIWLYILFGAVSCIVLALATTVRPSSRESVRQELIRRQAQTGLTFAWVDSNTQTVFSMTRLAVVSGVQAIWFKKQALISLKDSLEAFR